ncbi:MAG: hypothetical protein HC890_16735 [Chloroflexaceae bacterium]|nr:hypothetical protein [Chloroflexaceae bacterium]
MAARRLVAQRCLYGVDKNPFAVNLAKLSLWLFTLAKERPFTFLDHALKCGDSLVGLTRQEIGSFAPELPLLSYLQEKVDRAKVARAEIQTGDVATDADDARKRERLQEAEDEIKEVRLLADVQIAAFFEGGTKKKQRDEKRQELIALVRSQREAGDDSGLKAVSQRLRTGDRAVIPFNWEVSFQRSLIAIILALMRLWGILRFWEVAKSRQTTATNILHFFSNNIPNHMVTAILSLIFSDVHLTFYEKMELWV